MDSISFSDITYGPIQYAARQGGNLYFVFTANFSGTPPDTFNYGVEMWDRNNNVVKTVAGSMAANGKSAVKVEVHTPGTGDDSQPLAIGGYSSHFSASAAGYEASSEQVCHGITVPQDGGGGGCGCDDSCSSDPRS